MKTYMFSSNAYKSFKVLDFIFRRNTLQCNFWTVRIASPSPLRPFYPVRCQFGTPPINNHSRGTQFSMVNHGIEQDVRWNASYLSTGIIISSPSNSRQANLQKTMTKTSKTGYLGTFPPRSPPINSRASSFPFTGCLVTTLLPRIPSVGMSFIFTLAKSHY